MTTRVVTVRRTPGTMTMLGPADCGQSIEFHAKGDWMLIEGSRSGPIHIFKIKICFPKFAITID